MQHVPNSQDDYGFLTMGGLVYGKNCEVEATFRSAEDLLSGAEDPPIEAQGTKYPNSPFARRKQNSGIHKRFSSSQPNLRKLHTEQQKTFKVRFEMNGIHKNENEDRTTGKQTLSNSYHSNLPKDESSVEREITEKQNEQSLKDGKTVKMSWWRKIFSSSRKKTNIVKTAKGDSQSPDQRNGIANNERCEVTAGGDETEISDNLTGIDKNSNKFGKEDDMEALLTYAETAACRKEIENVSSRENLEELEIMQLAKSPSFSRRTSANDLLQDPITNGLRNSLSYDEAKISANSGKENIALKETTIKTTTQKVSAKCKEKSTASGKKSKFSFKSDQKSRKTNSKSETKLKDSKWIGERSPRDPTESPSQKEHDASVEDEETQPKSLYYEKKSSGSRLFEKYQANKGKDRKVLVHIHTKEEMPIKNGIPQWLTLSYQCMGALQHRRNVSPSNEIKKRPVSCLIESSFIGNEVVTTPIEVEKKDSNATADTKGKDTKVDRTVRVQVHSNPIATDLPGRKDEGEVDRLQAYTGKDKSKFCSGDSNTASKTPNACHKGPSYFEVNSDADMSTDTDLAAPNEKIEQERSFALTGVVTDTVPEIIARKHPYLTASTPLRHMAKCLRHAPLRHPQVAPPTGSSTITSPNDVQKLATEIGNQRLASKKTTTNSPFDDDSPEPRKLPRPKYSSEGDSFRTQRPRTYGNEEDEHSVKMLPQEWKSEERRISQTEIILARMRERVQRLGEISDECDSKSNEKILEKSSVNEDSSNYYGQNNNSLSQDNTNPTFSMMSLPLPKILEDAVKVSRDKPFTTKHPSERSAFRSLQEDRRDMKFRQLLSQKIKERNRHYDEGYSTASNETCCHTNRDNFVEETHFDADLWSTTSKESCSSISANSRTKSHEKTTATTTLHDGAIDAHGPEIPSIEAQKDTQQEQVASSARRRLRIMPFTLPLPKNKRYNGETLLDDRRFVQDTELAAGDTPLNGEDPRQMSFNPISTCSVPTTTVDDSGSLNIESCHSAKQSSAISSDLSSISSLIEYRINPSESDCDDVIEMKFEDDERKDIDVNHCHRHLEETPSSESEELCDSVKLGNMLQHQQQIKMTMLNEMNLVRLRYSNSDRSESDDDVSLNDKQYEVGDTYSARLLSRIDEAMNSSDEEDLLRPNFEETEVGDSFQDLSTISASDGEDTLCNSVQGLSDYESNDDISETETACNSIGTLSILESEELPKAEPFHKRETPTYSQNIDDHLGIKTYDNDPTFRENQVNRFTPVSTFTSSHQEGFQKYWGSIQRAHSQVYISGLSYICDDYETDL